MRKSIEPTYDSRETGLRFNVETRINGQAIRNQIIPDPFVRTTIRLAFWDVVKAFLFERKLHIEVLVNGDEDIVEDVMELDANYLASNSTRRKIFHETIETVLAGM